MTAPMNPDRSESVERVAVAIYEARVHTAIINGWSSEPEALRDRFRKAAKVALKAASDEERPA